MADEDWRVLARIILEERAAAQLVAQLVGDGFSLDEALSLVRFPFDD